MPQPLDFESLRAYPHRGRQSPYPRVWMWTVTADMVICENVPAEYQGEIIFDRDAAWSLGNMAGLVGKYWAPGSAGRSVPAVHVLQCPDRRWAAITTLGGLDDTEYIDISPEREEVRDVA